MPSERDKASGKPANVSRRKQRHIAVVAVIFAFAYGFSWLFGPADPISVYISTAVVTLLGSLAYWVGLVSGAEDAPQHDKPKRWHWREIVLATSLVLIACGWWVNHRLLVRRIEQLEEQSRIQDDVPLALPPSSTPPPTDY